MSISSSVYSQTSFDDISVTQPVYCAECADCIGGGTEDEYFTCPSPANDDPCNAIALSFAGRGINGPYDNSCASAQAGEPLPSTWSDNHVTNSLWFSFTATSPQNILMVSADYYAQHAIYEVVDCNDFSTFNQLSASMDFVNCNDLHPLNIPGLVPGQTYLVQVDGRSGVTCGDNSGNAFITLSNSIFKRSDIQFDEEDIWLDEEDIRSIELTSTYINSYPNPFSNSTTIEFRLADEDYARLEVFNSLGSSVEVLFDGLADANTSEKLTFNAKGLATGVYLYKLTTGTEELKGKMIVIK